MRALRPRKVELTARERPSSCAACFAGRRRRGSEMQNEIVRFGEFDANLTTGELYFRGIRRSIEYRAFQLFSLLIRRPGELVTNGEAFGCCCRRCSSRRSPP